MSIFGVLLSSVIFSTSLPNGFVFTKEIYLAILIGFTLFAYINTTQTYHFNQIDILVILLFSFSIIKGFFTTSTTGFHLCLRLCFLLFYISIACSDKKKKISNVVYYVIAIFFIIQVAIGVIQNFTFNSDALKVKGFFFNSGPFMIYTSALSFFVYPILFSHRERLRIRIRMALVLAVFILLAAQSDSRTSWLGLLVVIVLVLATYPPLVKKLRNKLCKRLFLLTAILLLFGICLLLYNYKIQSSIGRLFIWKNSWEVIKQNMLLGVGHGNFDVSYFEEQSSHFMKSITFSEVAGDVRFAFCDYLQIMAEEGIVGFILFLCIIIVILKRWQSVNRVVQSSRLLGFENALFCSFLFLVISSASSYPLQVIEINVLFWVLVALISRNAKCPYCFEFKTNSVGVWCVYPLFITSILLSLARVDAFLYVRSLTRSPSQSHELAESKVSILSSMKTYVSDDPNFALLLANMYIERRRYRDAIGVLMKCLSHHPEKECFYKLAEIYEMLQEYQKSEKTYYKVVHAYPHLLYPKYLLAMFYYRTGQTNQWQVLGREILYFKPKVYSDVIINIKSDIGQKMATSNSGRP
ncbi:O-antigen ligase family protein [Pedobacter faecalis]|uniref:O-antigen ligase family protein n=1 Tax=Pedobacter faecalis TaxID=3041495 RepID=UPI00254D0BDD|nr:O-antigen ligase family protein [Pedobacter sp. ELA7]